jgi:hypothetical protein
MDTSHPRRSIFLSDGEVRLSRLSLEDLLRAHGLDATQPYTRIDHPDREAHQFVQPPLIYGAPHD